MKVTTSKTGKLNVTLGAADRQRLASAHAVFEQIAFHCRRADEQRSTNAQAVCGIIENELKGGDDDDES